MNKPRKIRATFVTNEDSWKELKILLKEKGYPYGALGYYLTHAVEGLIVQLESDKQLIFHGFNTEQLRKK